MNLLCWWFGCERHEQDWRPYEEQTCMRCDGYIEYSDRVGDTRHKRFKDALLSAYRTVVPSKCRDCGRRWRKCDDAVFHDDIPF